MFPPSSAIVSSLSPDVAVGEVGRWTLVLLDHFAVATQDSHYDQFLIMSVLQPIGTLTDAEVFRARWADRRIFGGVCQ